MSVGLMIKNLSHIKKLAIALCQNAIDDVAVDIGEPAPDTVVVERQLCVVDA